MGLYCIIAYFSRQDGWPEASPWQGLTWALEGQLWHYNEMVTTRRCWHYSLKTELGAGTA